MKCPRCGNEVSQEEAFCGQCGLPNTPGPPAAKPTEMVSMPFPQSGLLNVPQPSNAQSGLLAPTQPYNTGMQAPPHTQGASLPPSPGLPPAVTPGPNQQGGFYQDATEAIALSPPGQSYPVGYQPQSFPGVPPAYTAARQARPQGPSVQTGNYTGPAYPPQQPYVTGQSYGMRSGPALPPQKQPNNFVIVIACVCLVVVLASIIGFGTIYLLKGRSNPQSNQQPSPTTATTPVATSTPTMQPTPTLTPTPDPTPAITPTPTADQGFSWCTQACTSNGFVTEYPDSWQLLAVSNAPGGIQFTHPTQADIYASFKADGATGGSASDLLTMDLQTNFAAKAGYTAPTTTTTTTISGETWVSAVAYYQSDAQTKERVEAYTTVYQNKGYVIELQAPDSQFDTLNTQYFVNMIGKFQFQQSTGQ